MHMPSGEHAEAVCHRHLKPMPQTFAGLRKVLDEERALLRGLMELQNYSEASRREAVVRWRVWRSCYGQEEEPSAMESRGKGQVLESLSEAELRVKRGRCWEEQPEPLGCTRSAADIARAESIAEVARERSEPRSCKVTSVVLMHRIYCAQVTA
eukprot:SAG31_NODE_4802_length_2947_cov_2.732093_3_plen_154_part_00